MRFWILLAAVIGYHVQDVWYYLTFCKHYRPEYQGMLVYAIVAPGWMLFHSYLFIGLTNAAIYAVVAYLLLLVPRLLRKLKASH